jgi:hypothetical protein
VPNWWDVTPPSAPQAASAEPAPWWKREPPPAATSDAPAPDRSNNATPTPDKDSGGHGFLDTLKNMGPRDWAAEAVRLGGGYLAGIPSAVPGIGSLVGAGVGGGSEALAELIAGKGYDPTSIGVASAVGAIPLGKVFKTGSDLATMGLNAARGAGLNVGVDVASKLAHGEPIDSWRDEILPAAIGGAGGAGATALHRLVAGGGAATEVVPPGDFDRVAGSAGANAVPHGQPGPTWPTGAPDAGTLQAARTQIRDPELQRVFDAAYGTRQPAEPALRAPRTPYETGGEADEMAPIRRPGPIGEDLGDVNDAGMGGRLDPRTTLEQFLQRFEQGHEGDETAGTKPLTPGEQDLGDVNDFAHPPEPVKPWWEQGPRQLPAGGSGVPPAPFRDITRPWYEDPRLQPRVEAPPPPPSDEQLLSASTAEAQPPAATATAPAPPAAAPAAAPAPEGAAPNIDSVLEFLGMKPRQLPDVGSGVPPEPPATVEPTAPRQLPDIRSGAPPAPPESAPELEVLDPATATLNASGESAASLEAMRREQGMKERGEQFVVYDRAGTRRPLSGPDAVDYHVQPGETYGVEGPKGFQVLDDAGGRAPSGPAPALAEAPPTAPGPTQDIGHVGAGDQLDALQSFFEHPEGAPPAQHPEDVEGQKYIAAAHQAMAEPPPPVPGPEEPQHPDYAPPEAVTTPAPKGLKGTDAVTRKVPGTQGDGTTWHVAFPDGRKYTIYRNVGSGGTAADGQWLIDGHEDSTASGAVFSKKDMLDHLARLDEGQPEVDKHTGRVVAPTIEEGLAPDRAKTKWRVETPVKGPSPSDALAAVQNFTKNPEAEAPGAPEPPAPKAAPVRETTPYKGYLIKKNPLNGATWVEKDGQKISWANSTEDAQQKIDSLTPAAAPAQAAATPAEAVRQFFDPEAHQFSSPRFDPNAEPGLRAELGGDYVPPAPGADIPESAEDRLRMVMGKGPADELIQRGIWKARAEGTPYTRSKDLPRFLAGGKPTYTPEQLQNYKFLWNKERLAMNALEELAGKKAGGGAAPPPPEGPEIPGWSGGGEPDKGGEGGFASTSALVPVATTLAGGALGPVLEPKNKKLGIGEGAAFGLLAGLAAHNPKLLNRLRYSNILSYLSVPKKLGGDIGELGFTMAEHPEQAGALAKNVFTRGTWDAAKAGFLRPTDQALIERAGLGRQGDLFTAPGESGEPEYKPRSVYNPLEISGRALSGITEGAQSIYERAGFSPEEADQRTFVNKPLSETGQGAVNLARKPLPNFLLPVAKVMTNVLERGISRTPGLAELPSVRAFSGLTPQAARRASAITALGMLGAGGAGYLSAKGGPLENYSKEIDASPLLTGGAMVPVGAALGAGRALGTHGGGAADALAALAAGFAKGVPLPHGFEPSDLSPARAKATVARLLSQYFPLGGVGKLTSPVDPARFDTTGTLFGPTAAEQPLVNELLLHQKPLPKGRVGLARKK